MKFWVSRGFQHTAARRRLDLFGNVLNKPNRFQHTAARRRLVFLDFVVGIVFVFQHTAARRRLARSSSSAVPDYVVSTHSRPKAAGGSKQEMQVFDIPFQHTAARRRLGWTSTEWFFGDWFQHTAARRRLARNPSKKRTAKTVSTHSRPKAAGTIRQGSKIKTKSFNTQPPEGGWLNQRRP